MGWPATQRNRTFGVTSRCSTLELWPHLVPERAPASRFAAFQTAATLSQLLRQKWWSLRASIPPPPVCKTGTLANELRPHVKWLRAEGTILATTSAMSRI